VPSVWLAAMDFAEDYGSQSCSSTSPPPEPMQMQFLPLPVHVRAGFPPAPGSPMLGPHAGSVRACSSPLGTACGSPGSLHGGSLTGSLGKRHRADFPPSMHTQTRAANPLSPLNGTGLELPFTSSPLSGPPSPRAKSSAGARSPSRMSLVSGFHRLAMDPCLGFRYVSSLWGQGL